MPGARGTMRDMRTGAECKGRGAEVVITSRQQQRVFDHASRVRLSPSPSTGRRQGLAYADQRGGRDVIGSSSSAP
jgi:hypothetical protein